MPNRKIKIAHIVTLLELGGAQQNTLHTLKELDRSRFEPLLLAGKGALLDKEASDGGYRRIVVKNLVRPVRPWSDLKALFELRRILKKEKPDVVHTHSSKAGILGRWAARLAGVPVIVHTVHGFGFHPEQGVLTRSLYVTLERWCAGITQALVMVSKDNWEEAQARGVGKPEQYRLIRSGIPLSLFQSLARRPNAPEGFDLRPEHRLITTVGPFKPQKNLLDFIRAAALVREKFPEARFAVVGDGEQRPMLEREIQKRGLSDTMFLAGWRRDIPNVLMRTHIFVLTSLWEGLPRALVEAMAAGIPCVANAVNGVKDVVADGINGFLVPPKRPDLTAARVGDLLRDPETAIRIGQKARRTIGQEFDIDHMVRQQEALYLELLGHIHKS